MKKTFRVIVAFACVALVCSCSGKKSEAPKGVNYQISDSQLAAVQKAINGGETPAQKAKSIDELLSVESTQMDSLSYCMGANMGMGIKAQLAAIPFDLQIVKAGLVKGFVGVSEQSHEEAVEVLRKFFSEEFGKRQAEYQKAVAADSTAVFNPFTSNKECKEVSYSFGNDIGSNLKKSKLPIKLNWLWNGFQTGWNGDAAKDQDKILKFLNHYFLTVVPAQNAARSKAWIEAKKQEEGVQTTESGLAYKVIEAGDMSKAAKNNADMVKVHYVGKLQDGTVFDASRFEDRSKEQQKMMRMYQPSKFDKNGKPLEADEPIEFPLNGVIAGWTEGMKLIGPGGKILLYIPAELAYGPRGAGQQIGPNEALEFVVELIDVTPTEVEPKDPTKENVRPLPTKKPVKK
jgi:FKBP-type peptidyl-prolyl cis-trans isomerase FkpA